MINTKRPSIPTLKSFVDTTKTEHFQNTVIRPIIKNLHTLLIIHLTHFIKTKNKDFSSLKVEKQMDYINSILAKENTYKQELKGMVIGNFTLEELQHYLPHSKELGKRIITIINQRFIDSIKELNMP